MSCVTELSRESQVEESPLLAQFGTVINIQLTLSAIKVTPMVISLRCKVTSITYLSGKPFFFFEL